ncbi:MAG: glycosyltransferase family 2 protein [Simkaniaceae bacterium]|nr:glycosyltransferase family 2 protein [Candidatus Sacchlamyda saccharinae]
MKKLILFLFLVPALWAKPSICLNMIVKDEADVIERSLGSVKHLIDYWVIFDTGSSDGTQEKIRKFMKDVPGELHERPWVDFAHNRNEALVAARGKGDYLLFMDADEIFEYEEGFVLPKLDKDFYTMTLRQMDAADCTRVALVNMRHDWKWEGVLHEVISCVAASSGGHLEKVINICNTAIGGRSKVSTREKYLKDAKVFEEALKKEPGNSRYMYYLGISYSAAGEHGLAVEAFRKRAGMTSLDVQETYMALYNLGLSQEKSGDLDGAIDSYFKAHSFRPIRAEPLYQAASLYRKKGNVLLGYLLSKYALTIPYPEGENCVDYTAYDHKTLIEFANCALLCGKVGEGLKACEKLLENPNLPQEYKGSVLSNLEYAKGLVAQ